MANNVRKLERKPRAKKTTVVAVAPGLHAGTVELEADGAFKARLASGELVTAGLAKGVERELALEALRDRRTVLLSVTGEGASILGALQTAPTRSAEPLHVRASSIELEADEGLVLRAGKARIVLEPDGAIRFVGDAMTMRVAQALRVLAANVELP